MASRRQKKTKSDTLYEYVASHSLHHFVEYDYDSYGTTCRKCYCDGYSRCSRYEGLRVTEVYLRGVRDAIYALFSSEFIASYCADRLLRIRGIYDPNKWEIFTCDDYYGEEVSHVECDALKTLHDELAWLSSRTSEEMIKYVLEAEYGYLLPRLENRGWSEEVVLYSDLIAGNEEYRRKISDVKNYDIDEDLPIGLYEMQGNKYRLIDGYHRYAIWGNLIKDRPHEGVTILLAD